MTPKDLERFVREYNEVEEEIHEAYTVACGGNPDDPLELLTSVDEIKIRSLPNGNWTVSVGDYSATNVPTPDAGARQIQVDQQSVLARWKEEASKVKLPEV